MKTRFSLFLCVLFFTSTGFAQNARKQTFATVKSATVNVSGITEDWSPYAQNLEMPAPGSGTTKGKLLALKQQLREKYPLKGSAASTQRATPASPPYLHRNFQGNPYNFGVPNDNDVAISNAGFLISVINSTIYMFDVNQDSLLKTFSLDAFSSSLGITGSKFDPKVLYDPAEDKFILTFLNGYTSSTSYIIVAFSESGDPTGNWNLYSLPGNPLNNTLWSDYPMIAVTEKEFFLTINLLYNDSSWQEGFAETIIWQINKESGYSGQTLNSTLHNSIFFNGAPIRNLCPIKGGNFVYGPNIYFLSNKNFTLGSDTVFLVEITDTINAPSAAVTVTLLSTSPRYHIPPTARQSNNHTFETNDARVLGGFIENGQIQYVQNTLDTTTGFAAVYHGIITNLTATPVVSGSIIGDSIMDLGYPNISYAGLGAGDHSSTITFNNTAPTVFAGYSAINYNNGNYSAKTTVKTGLNYVNVIGGPYERWGDYSGSQRKYDEPGKVWVSASFGTQNRKNGTWIAELRTSPASIEKNEQKNSNAHLFPNPAHDQVTVSFYMEKEGVVEFALYNGNGMQVKTLLNDRIKKGENLFSFSTAPLPAGIYFLRATGNSQLIFNKKVIKN